MGRHEAAISVIVPIYNVKRYLKQCLDSILAQTFEDIEVICVDDGSTDGSGELIDEYASRDGRITAIHKENTGYGNSMNAGIDSAKGEYIGIVESDDAIESGFYETLYEAAKKNDLDIVKSEFYLWWEEAGYRHRMHRPHMDGRYGVVMRKDRQFLRCNFLMNTWSGLYKRSFLNKYHIRHHESPGAAFQDNGFWMQGMLFADRVMVLDYAGYLYRQDNETASVKDPRKVYTMVDEYEWLHQKLEGDISSAEMILVDSFHMTRGYWSIFRIADEYKREYLDRLIDDYGKYGYSFVRDLYWQDLFADIADDPDGYCNKIIDTKEKVCSFIERSDSIIIYGAGQRGERLYRIMLDYGWSGKVQCFIESGVPKREKIGRIPIYNIDSENALLENVAVIISAARTSKWHDEMAKALKKHGITEYMDSEELFDNFYNFT